MERTSITVGRPSPVRTSAYDGSGVGVAVIDSGITSWHDDLSDAGGPASGSFASWTSSTAQETPYDDYGHGTHVAGIIAGNGFDSDGARAGIAPGAHLVVLKVLDENGRGYISDVIAAIDYAIAQRDALNIRVINLSVASGVYESYNVGSLDARRRARGQGRHRRRRRGGQQRPHRGRLRRNMAASRHLGNAPWVLTVGASSHMGTAERADDTIALFTSRGPTAVDRHAKPDLVAPGIGIESLSNPDSSLYSSNPGALLAGTRPVPALPYLSLSGTSMSAPVVSGTVALMLQANPALTPNAVKAILQYTAEVYPQLRPADGRRRIPERQRRDRVGPVPVVSPRTGVPGHDWLGSPIDLGQSSLSGGRLTPSANAWSTDVTWGATSVDGPRPRVGLRCCVRGLHDNGGPWRVDNGYSRNVVWGWVCGGADCDDALVDRLRQLDRRRRNGGVGYRRRRNRGVGNRDGGETVVWGTSCSGLELHAGHLEQVMTTSTLDVSAAGAAPERVGDRRGALVMGGAVEGGPGRMCSTVIAAGAVRGHRVVPAGLSPSLAVCRCFSSPPCLTSLWKLNLPIPLASGSTLSVSYAANLMALLLLGPRHALIIALAGVWTQCTFSIKQPYPWYQHDVQPRG